MIIHYTLRGSMEAPEGSKLNDRGTAIVLPDGRFLKLWESWELHSLDPESDPVDIHYEAMRSLGFHYDGEMANFELEDVL